jgi:hypothetical protein
MTPMRDTFQLNRRRRSSLSTSSLGSTLALWYIGSATTNGRDKEADTASEVVVAATAMEVDYWWLQPAKACRNRVLCMI